MEDKRPLILICNDDGYDAPGIRHLAKIASSMGDVVIVAPDSAQSGKSSALTVNAPLMLTQHPDMEGGIKVFSVNGTPVDCVKVAIHAVLDRKPDLVLSGINHGSNAAINNIYSGTMGAAMEGCIIGVPSIGYSLLSHSPNTDLEPLTPFIRQITSRVIATGLPEGVCLNVNFPARCTPKGLKIVRGAKGHWTEEYQDFATPHGSPFFWLTGKFHNEEPDNPETDEYWLGREYGTIVPIRPDQAALDMITSIKDTLKL